MNYEGPQLAYIPATREYMYIECGAKVDERVFMLYSAVKHECAKAKPLEPAYIVYKMKQLGNDNMTDAEIVG